MFYLKPNVPSWERILRVAGAALLAVIAYAGVFPFMPGWVLACIAAVLGLTAVIGFCPARALVGRRPARKKQ